MRQDAKCQVRLGALRVDAAALLEGSGSLAPLDCCICKTEQIVPEQHYASGAWCILLQV